MDTRRLAAVQVGNLLVEVKYGTDAVHHLRTALIELAYGLVEADPEKKGFLVLVDPQITAERLEKEWHQAAQTLQPKVMDRLSLVLFQNGHFRGFPNDPDPQTRAQLETIVRRDLEHRGVRLHRGWAYNEILKVLVYQWLLNKGPVTADCLAKTVGCSYPTVASALKRLSNTIRRHSNRQIELAKFPRDEWARLVAVSESARSSTRFADRSGQPRSPDSLLGRLRKMEIPDIGVGGVFGAKHYYSNLDLVGSPRLDLTIHATGSRRDFDFVERLDPGLRKLEDPTEPASLVIHFIRRQQSLFQKGGDGLKWADPVECLLDLHEARLEPQALEFLNSFARARGQVV